jgi:aspartyl-tRNA(Asn)/glutamyl-tRNA(Gln) amidotransferase subunit C
MSIDKDIVRRIARLSRLAVQEEQIAPMEAELNAILAWVEQLKEVDVTGVAPMTGVETVRMPLRADVVTDGGYPEDLMRNAPQAEDNFFVVPKVVE